LSKKHPNPLRELRRQQGLSIEVLAVRAGVSSGTLRRIERQTSLVHGDINVSLAKIHAVAEALGLKLRLFLGELEIDTAPVPSDPDPCSGRYEVSSSSDGGR
jgi:transcriptional regulator with XRE-family HTH domain